MNSEAVFEQLKDLPIWTSRQIQLFGKYHVIPRLESWVADPGLSYRYSGKTYTPAIWPEELSNIRDSIELEFGWRANGCLLNRYRSGVDSMGWHADNEPELGLNPTVFILSLGSNRDIMFRALDPMSRKIKIFLSSGDLLLMSGGLQHHWQHSLPKRAHADERISCTFRQIKTPDNQSPSASCSASR